MNNNTWDVAYASKPRNAATALTRPLFVLGSLILAVSPLLAFSMFAG